MYNVFDALWSAITGKQDSLVSGTNIKTINGVSVLGSGDLPISGGGGVSDGDKGDITVSGSGTIWTIDNLAVNDAKINDVAATKVSEDSTHRFATDAEKTTWNGKADLVGGKVPSSQIPSIAITEFLGTVANQAAMLALIGEQGDWCIRSDEQSGYVLIGNTPTSLADWQKIVTPASPVSSVNGQVGTVVLGKSDVGLSNVDNTSDANKPVSTLQAAAIALKQDTLISGTNIKTIGGISILGPGNLPIPDPAGWTTIVKSANQDTLSGTFSDVIDFSFSVVSGGIYMIQIESVYGCASSGTEIAYGFNVTSGNFTGKIQTQRIQSTQTTLTLIEPQAVSTSALLSTMGRNNDISIPHPFTITASITCSANATFKIQHRAGVNNNFVRTFKGSILKYKRID